MPQIMLLFEKAFDRLANHKGSPVQFRRMLLYILMPFLKVRTIAECSQALGLPKDRLYSMLGKSDTATWLKLLRTFSYSRVFSVIQQYSSAYSAKKSRLRITIGCDDSGFAKSGKVMPFVGLLWDHAIKRVCSGTQALYFFVVIGDQKLQFPLDLRLHRGRGGKGRPGRPSKKKTAMVIEMLKDFSKAARAAGVTLSRVDFVADSWFVNGGAYATCRSLGIPVVMKGKANLIFYIKGRKIRGSELCRMDHSWRNYEGPRKYIYARYEAKSPTLGAVILTVVKEENRIYYLIGSDAAHTSPKMIADYKLRWGIEVFFRDSKQTLYLGEFRFQTKAKIIGHFVLRSISYHFADWIRRKKFKGRKTIGEVSSYLGNIIRSQNPHRIKKLGIHGLVEAFADSTRSC